MTHVFGLVMFLLALVVHEAGHAIAMSRRGVEIKEMGIGLPLSDKLKLTLRPRFLPFPLVLTPFLLGAYVMPSDEGEKRLKSLSYKDQAICSAAGVIVNVSFGGFLVIIALLARGLPSTSSQWLLLAAALGLTVLPLLLRRPLSVFLPIIGIGMLVYLVHAVFASFDQVGGPGAIIGMAASTSTWTEGIVIGAVLSWSLAAFNVVPLVPLDGGRVVSAFLLTRGWHKSDAVYTHATLAAFLVLVIVVIGKDIVSFLT